MRVASAARATTSARLGRTRPKGRRPSDEGAAGEEELDVHPVEAQLHGVDPLVVDDDLPAVDADREHGLLRREGPLGRVAIVRVHRVGRATALDLVRLGDDLAEPIAPAFDGVVDVARGDRARGRDVGAIEGEVRRHRVVLQPGLHLRAIDLLKGRDGLRDARLQQEVVGELDAILARKITVCRRPAR